MAEFIYVLCALSSLLCAYLLIGGYRQNPTTLLLWSAICFLGLALSNILLVVDLMIIDSIDFAMWRAGVTLASMASLIFGLVWDEV